MTLDGITGAALGAFAWMAILLTVWFWAHRREKQAIRQIEEEDARQLRLPMNEHTPIHR